MRPFLLSLSCGGSASSSSPIRHALTAKASARQSCRAAVPSRQATAPTSAPALRAPLRLSLCARHSLARRTTRAGRAPLSPPTPASCVAAPMRRTSAAHAGAARRVVVALEIARREKKSMATRSVCSKWISTPTRSFCSICAAGESTDTQESRPSVFSVALPSCRTARGRKAQGQQCMSADTAQTRRSAGAGAGVPDIYIISK